MEMMIKVFLIQLESHDQKEAMLLLISLKIKLKQII